jgi:hypothetical protein
MNDNKSLNWGKMKNTDASFGNPKESESGKRKKILD